MLIGVWRSIPDWLLWAGLVVAIAVTAVIVARRLLDRVLRRTGGG